MRLMFGIFPLLLALAAPVGAIYFAVMVFKISQSLERIANSLEKESLTKKNAHT
ncbi:MAG: hypothetical protein JJU16_02815 [Alkalibacterium sp.]|nr:hypothetical protein [Alkalibacterium sp.]